MIKVNSNRLPLTPPKPSPRVKMSKPRLDAKLSNQLDGDYEILGHEDTFSFLSPGVQKNVLRKLRQGYFGLDAELDLHGLTSHYAKQRFLVFIESCVKNGCRCIQIVHGKGYGSENQMPVLKNHLNAWLRQHNDVLAFCSAAPRQGGAGAVMVLLHLSDKF